MKSGCSVDLTSVSMKVVWWAEGAFWCNGPAMEQDCRRFVIMGFNYERSVKEMVHDYGHRAESLLAKSFDSETFLRKLYRQESTLSLPIRMNNFYWTWEQYIANPAARNMVRTSSPGLRRCDLNGGRRPSIRIS